MPARSLTQLSELCGNSLPNDYLALLSEYPEALKSASRNMAGHTAEGLVSQVELIADPDSVLEINREARRYPVDDPNGQEFTWPSQLVVIGETGAGDYYCLDVDGEEPGVIRYLHQTCEFEIIADTLSEFVGLLIEAFSAQHGE